MTANQVPQKYEKFDIQAYSKPKNIDEIRSTHVPFNGSPLKHPTDSSRVYLVIDPASPQKVFYEFKKKDISFVEEMPNITDYDGETLTFLRVWVKKMSVALRCTPFLVEEIAGKEFYVG